MTRRQTLTVEYPDNYGPFQAGQTFHATRILSATTVERVPDRSLLTIKIEIDRPDDGSLMRGDVDEAILEFLADDAEGQREPLVTASMHPEVREVTLASIVT